MATVLVTSEYLLGIANAIRSKNGSSDAYLPSEMAAAIQALDTDPDVVSKTITTNGTYAASSEGYDGYSSVTVNVDSSLPSATGVSF